MEESDIKRISWQILQGVDYCHRNGVSITDYIIMISCDVMCLSGDPQRPEARKYSHLQKWCRQIM